MKEDLISNAISDFRKRDYIEGVLLISKTGVPIFGNPPNFSQPDLFSILAGVIFGGAEELIGHSERSVKSVGIITNDAKHINMVPIGDKYVVVAVFNKFDQNIEKDFADFLTRLESAFK